MLLVWNTYIGQQNQAQLSSLIAELEYQEDSRSLPLDVDRFASDPDVGEQRLDELVASNQRLFSSIESINSRVLELGNEQALLSKSFLEVVQAEKRLAENEVTLESVATQQTAPRAFSDPDPAVQVDNWSGGGQYEVSEGFSQRVQRKLEEKITGEGIDQGYAGLVSTGVEQISITNPQLFEGVLFDQAVCSAYRCAVSADISGALFSTARIVADKEFIANDTYYNFVAVLQAGIDEEMGRGTQVSVTRNEDKVLLNIMPRSVQPTLQ